MTSHEVFSDTLLGCAAGSHERALRVSLPLALTLSPSRGEGRETPSPWEGEGRGEGGPHVRTRVCYLRPPSCSSSHSLTFVHLPSFTMTSRAERLIPRRLSLP